MLAARRVGISARALPGPRQLAPKLPPYVQSLLRPPPRPTAADARLRLFLAPRPDLQPLYVVPSRFFSQPRGRNARVDANARVRDNLRLLQRTPDDADLARAIFQDIRVEGGATLTEFAATTIASALLQAGKVGESVKVLEYARGKRVRALPKVYRAVISAASEERQHAAVLRVWDALPSGHYKASPWDFATALVAAVRLRQRERVFEILDEVKASEVKVDKIYGRVVGAACQTKQHELVCEILDYMHANGVDCTSAYVRVHRLAFKSGEYDFVLQLLRLMKTHGIDPTEEYKHQIRSLHKAGLHDRLQSVFESMRKEGCVCDEEMYGTAVDSAIRVKNRDLAMSILDDMQRDAGLSKTPTAIFTRAVGVAVLTNQHQLALDVFDFMARTDIDASTAYVTATRTAFKSKQYDFVFDILQKMTENGVDASELYSHVVASFNKLEYYDQVLRAFKGMRECGYEGGKDIVTTAVHAANKTDRQGDVMTICNHDGRQYTSELVAAVRSKQKKRVFEILDEVKANEVEDDNMYGRAVGASCKTEQHELVCELLDYMHANGVDLTGAYVCAQRIALKSGKYDFALELLRLMKTHGMDPTEDYKNQIRSLHKAGLHDRVLSVFESMRKEGCVCDKDMYMTAIDSAIRVNNSELLMSILDDMKRKVGLAKTRAAVFRTAFKSKQYDFVFAILRKMTENGVDASGEYSHAVMTFNELECYDQVLCAFKGMRECGYEEGEGIVTTAVEAAIKLERHDDVMAICNHNGRQYTSALVTAVCLKQKKRVFEILDEVKANEVEDDNMYERAVGAACITKQHKLLCEILDYMHANGVDTTDAYVSARQIAFKSGENDFVLELLRLMQTHGMDPTEQYKHQLMSLHKAGLHDRLQSIFEAMQKAGCVCDEGMYGTAVDSAIRVKNRELLMSILDDMRRNAGLSKMPSAVFRRGVGAAVWTNQPQLLFDVFDFMDHTDTATSAVYTSGIRSAFRSKQYDFVFDILRKMTENGVDASEEYSHAVMSFSKLECYDQVLRAFEAMRGLGYGQEKVLCMTALRAATKLDRHDDVIAICNGLSGKSSVTTPLHSHALEQAHSTNKQEFWERKI
ncbi:hypothetical protein PF002_g22673 [Phytophthora fragariae]|uniref:Pentacotripeptide-repeat region of PRORP domain-containing protein n=1 Tax=Phytophthora fragariae TaxID=53985 RepID=A0A6A3X7K8_9STRA|nr:hypothetical protein PF002_g22673 [Phytophthora fragariae]